MLSDEAFGNLLIDIKRALEAWADQHRTAAEIIIENDPSYWRIHAYPSEAALCPVELVLRPDRNYDLVIDNASLEDQPIERFDLLTELFDAIAAGKPVVRTFASQATQQLLGTRTIVALSDGSEWRVDQLTLLGEKLGLEGAIVTERRFASYDVRQQS
ncbi:MAG: hypothetical protein AAF346_19810 [Pseudomonadota bacterium]